MRILTKILLLLVLLSLPACQKSTITEKAPMNAVQQQIDKLAPVTLTHDLTHLPANEVQALKCLVKASKVIDQLFLEQVYEKNLQIQEALKASSDDPDKTYLEFFKIMFGPWNRLDKDTPLIGSETKPPGAAFYPTDLTKGAFETWIKNHPDDRDSFEQPFTVIRRDDKGLKAIPYSEFYQEQLEAVTQYVLEAAALTEDQSLKKFLKSRAKAFSNNDYYQSDMDWMDLSGDIEVVIGPYEVYEDGLFGYKAAFESFVCVVDQQESKKQDEITRYLTRLEKTLPIPDKHKNPDRGSESPMKVVNLLFSSGDTKAGVQTSAFNLPNDERVREAKGSKKVMLKNVMRAKFDKCWIPIVNTALAEKDLKRISFDAYFNHVVMHEVAHGLGPGNIEVDGRQTTVSKELKELYPTIEEAKADVLGVLTCQLLIDWGVFPKSLEETLYASNLGGMFRSIRFGIEAAHGGGVTIQLNYYLDQGGCTVTSDGKFAVNDAKMKKAVRGLAEKLLIIEAEGDYEAAKALIDEMRVIRPAVQAALDRLTSVPIDIRPIYPIENEL